MFDIRRKLRLTYPTRITPKQLIHNFVSSCLRVVIHLQRTLNFLNLQHWFQSVTDSTVRTKDVFFDDCSNRHFLEKTVDPTEKRVLIIDVLFELCSTLIAESLNSVDLSVFVRAPKENNVFWEFYFEREKEKNSLYTPRPFVHIVAQK